jgi:hypothetical protein
VLRRVGLGLSRVPLEHAFSIYEMRALAKPPWGSHVPEHTKSQGRKHDRLLCHNCVRYPLKPRSSAVIYGDTPIHIVVAGSRWWEPLGHVRK